jgi:hypothetical protein
MEKAKSAAKSASAKSLGKTTPTKGKADVLVDVATEVEVLNRSKAFDLVDELVQSGGLSEFRLGGVLAHIQDEASKEGGESWLDGHDSFRSLVEARFSLHYRKAMYLISIYKHLVEKQIPWNAVKDVGWTKLKELAPILTAKNVEMWVNRSKKLTVMQLQEAIKKAQSKGSDATETSSVSTMTFKVHADQKEGIREALDKAKAETKTDVDTVALHNICQGYLGNSVEIETSGGAPDAPTKPKAKGKLTAFHKERVKILLKEISEDLLGDGAELVLEVFGEIWPEISVNVEM